MKKNLIFIFFLLQTYFLAAQVSFTASVSKNKLGVNEQFSLTFTLNASGDRFAPPNLSDFSILSGPSTSSSTTIINGKMTRENTYTYYLRAKRVGIYTIGPAKVTVKGKEYFSGNTTIQVLKSAPQVTSSQSAEGKARQNVFLELELSNTQPYAGEQIVAAYKLYFSQDIRSPQLLKNPSFTGFWHEDFDLGDNYPIERVLRDGKPFQVATLKKILLIPQRSGNLTIDGMDLEVPVAIPTNQRDFFGRVQSRIINIICSTESKVLQVKELPLEGKPSNFSGAVGNFQFSTRLDRDSIQANESATLSMRVSGAGNLRMIELPKFKIPNDLEAYEPKFKESIELKSEGLNGYRRVEHLLIPRNKGTYKVRTESFNFFNPNTKAYVIVDKPSFTLTVEGDSYSASTTVVLNNIAKEDVDFIGKDILYIKTQLGSLKSSKALFLSSRTFNVLFVIPLVLLLIALLLFFLIKRSMIDVQRLKQGSHLKQALKVLYSKSNNPHLAVVQALQLYFYKKWGVERVQFDKEMISDFLQERNVESDLIQTLNEALEQCEMARFTGSSEGVDSKHSSLLDQVKNCMERLENY